MKTDERKQLSDVEVQEIAEPSKQKHHHSFHNEVTDNGEPHDKNSVICYVGHLDD